MTIYVCQELEQNRAPLQQKRDGGGDSSLCGELGGGLPPPCQPEAGFRVARSQEDSAAV